jgi:hypothetical protein
MRKLTYDRYVDAVFLIVVNNIQGGSFGHEPYESTRRAIVLLPHLEPRSGP